MKSILTTFLLLLLFTQSFGQSENQDIDGNNEIRLNLLNSLLGSVEVQYESLFQDNSSINVFLGVGYDLHNSAYNSIFNISPGYRQYFSKKKASGFFIEANTRFSYDKWEEWTYEDFPSYNSYSKTEKGLNIGLGVGMGAKMLTHSGLSGTIKGGIGRFLTNHKGYGPEYYPNIEISIGKRF